MVLQAGSVVYLEDCKKTGLGWAVTWMHTQSHSIAGSQIRLLNVGDELPPWTIAKHSGSSSLLTNLVAENSGAPLEVGAGSCRASLPLPDGVGFAMYITIERGNQERKEESDFFVLFCFLSKEQFFYFPISYLPRVRVLLPWVNEAHISSTLIFVLELSQNVFGKAGFIHCIILLAVLVQI